MVLHGAEVWSDHKAGDLVMANDFEVMVSVVIAVVEAVGEG